MSALPVILWQGVSPSKPMCVFVPLWESSCCPVQGTDFGEEYREIAYLIWRLQSRPRLPEQHDDREGGWVCAKGLAEFIDQPQRLLRSDTPLTLPLHSCESVRILSWSSPASCLPALRLPGAAIDSALVPEGAPACFASAKDRGLDQWNPDVTTHVTDRNLHFRPSHGFHYT
jgi:hypothetical protein